MDNNQFGNGIPTDNNYQGRPMQQNMNNVPMQNTQNTNPQFVIGGQNNGYRNPNPPTQPTQNGGVYGQYNNPQYMQQPPVAPLQPPTQIPIPPVPQVPPTPQTPPMPPEQPKKAKKDKKVKGKKKKKHIGLWIFLSLILIGAGIFGLFKWQNNVATEYLQNILSDQPFEYVDTNYCDYVTDNIVIPQEIEVGEGDVEKIQWSSDNPNVLNTKGEVNRPSNANAVVKLTAEVKHGLGTGKKDYYITVVKTDVIDDEDIFVLTPEDIETGIGNNNMVITYNEDDIIDSIDGNFNSTIVSSADDAIKVLNKYRQLMNIGDEVEFKVYDVQTALEGKCFMIEQYYEGLPVFGRTVTMTTNASNHLDSINLNIVRNVNANTSGEMTEDEINSVLSSHYGITIKITEHTKGIFVSEEKAHLVYKCTALGQENDKIVIKTVYLDINSKKVVADVEISTGLGSMTTAYGEDVFGEDQVFKANKAALYFLEDTGRNIKIIDGSHNITDVGDEIFWGDDAPMMILVLKKQFGLPISSAKNTFKDANQGVSAYKNFITTYDWYKNTLGRNSFDGKGREIKCIVNSPSAKNNAAYLGGDFRFFICGDAPSFKYALCAGVDVIGHEYTHGVFDAITADGSSMNFSSINEAYADIFGSLIDNDWQMAEWLGEPLRDSTGASGNELWGTKYPDTYLGENWSNTDCHINGILLSRAAFRMTQRGFTNEDVAKIWYQSMFYGYDDWSNFLDVRSNVEKAARKLGYTDEQLIVIGDIFGELGIGEMPTKQIQNMSVEGHTFKDDTVEKDFLIVWSPIGSLFGSPILIYEEDNSLEQTMTDAQISEKLTQYMMDVVVGDNQIPDNEYLDIKFDIKVEYSRMPQWIMKIVKNFAEEARTTMIESVSSETGQTSEDTGSWFNLFFLVQTYHGTSYDFWTECMGMDFSEFSFE